MFLKTYLIALPIFLGIDFIWLTFIARDFYSKQIGFLMSKNPNLIAALVFYLIFIAGLVVFVITPALEKKMWINALLMGAFFGLVSYATYDLTNLATVKNWPIMVTIVDLIWGSAVSGAVSIATYFISIKLGF